MGLSETYLAFVRELLAPAAGDIVIRRMFGGAGVFADGEMFALVADDILYFKVDQVTQPAFRAEGSEPFRYAKGEGRTVVMSYWRVPERLYEDAEEMADWVLAARAVAHRQRSGARNASDGDNRQRSKRRR